MAPSSVLGVLCDLLGGVDGSAGEDFLDWDKLAAERVAGEVYGFGEGSEILLVVAGAGVEVVVGDVGHVEGIGGAKGDCSGVVARVGLEDCPGEPVVLVGSVEGVAGEVATEVDWAAESEDVIVVVISHARLVEHGGAKSRGSVDAAVA